MTTQINRKTGHGFSYKDLVILDPQKVITDDPFAKVLSSMLPNSILPILYTLPPDITDCYVRTIIFADSVWKMTVHKTAMTLICLSIKSHSDMLHKVSTIVQYVINTIKDISKTPNIANIVRYSLYFYTKENIKIEEYDIKIKETKETVFSEDLNIQMKETFLSMKFKDDWSIYKLSSLNKQSFNISDSLQLQPSTTNTLSTTKSPIFGTTAFPGFGTTKSTVDTTKSPVFGTTAFPIFGTTKSPVDTTKSTIFGTEAFNGFGTTKSTVGTTKSPVFDTTAFPIFGTTKSPVDTTKSTIFGTKEFNGFGTTKSKVDTTKSKDFVFSYPEQSQFMVIEK